MICESCADESYFKPSEWLRTGLVLTDTTPVAFLCSCPRLDGTLERNTEFDMFGDEGHLFDWLFLYQWNSVDSC